MYSQSIRNECRYRFYVQSQSCFQKNINRKIQQTMLLELFELSIIDQICYREFFGKTPVTLAKIAIFHSTSEQGLGPASGCGRALLCIGDPFQVQQTANIRRIKTPTLQLHLTNMTPRKGARIKKTDKHSDSETDTESPTEATRETAKEHMAKSNDLAKVNPKVFGRLIVFGAIFLLTFATRFYALEDPSHIW